MYQNIYIYIYIVSQFCHISTQDVTKRELFLAVLCPEFLFSFSIYISLHLQFMYFYCYDYVFLLYVYVWLP
jgi:hypothetical protein